jgi:conjugal transfer pilus assembly protein TraW
MSSSEPLRWALGAVLGLGLLVGAAWAQLGPQAASGAVGWDMRDLGAIADHAEAVRRQAEGMPGVSGIAGAAEGRRMEGTPAARGVLPPPPPGTPLVEAAAEERDPMRRPLLIFVSASIGEGALREALREAADDGHATVVWRGLAPGERLRDAALRMAGLLQGISPIPPQGIDPPLFRRHGIEAVPAIVDPLTGSELRGTLSLARMRAVLREREAAGDARPFSERVGSTTAVAERDLAEELRARAAALDPQVEMRRSAEQWWRRQEPVELPPASRDRVRRHDPTLYLQADLRGPGGMVVAPAGTRVNPLDRMPFASVVLVFDARDARQVEWARGVLAEGAATRPHVLLAAGFDRAGGWDGHTELVRRIGSRVQLLSPQLRERLGLEVVPSRIEAEGTVLRIEEVALGRLPAAPVGAQPREVRHERSGR